MPNLFLTSSFADVAARFPEFAGNPAGRSVAFIPTASMVEAYRGYVDDGRHALRSLGMTVEECDIAAAPLEHIARALQQSDYIYVSGGNTFYLLQEMRRKNVDCMLADHISQGKTYIGESAGTLVLSPDIACYAPMENPAAAPELKGTKGLALIPFYPLVHYRSDPFVEVCEKILAAHQGRLDIRPIANHELFAVRGGVIETWTVAKAV